MILLVAAVAAELGQRPGAPLGVGPLRAAASMARLLVQRRPDAVVLVGSAGAYPGGPAVGSAIAARRLGIGQAAAAMGLGYGPLAPVLVDADPEMNARLGLPLADVLTLECISTDAALIAALTASQGGGWTVEHMEAGAAARVCADAGVPFAAVLGIANRVGPDAHAEWLAHRGAAEAKAGQSLSALLSG